MSALDHTLHLGPRPNHNAEHAVKLAIENVSFWYGSKQALKNVSVDIYANEVTAFLGPSGCGKTTLLRCINRTLEIIPDTRMQGRILLDGVDIHDPDIELPLLRRRFGWIAQRPNPFPWSIRTNILYGPTVHGLLDGRENKEALLESSLRRWACGTRSATGSMPPETISRSASSSGFASRAPSPRIPMCC